MQGLGVDLVLVEIREENGLLKTRIRKMKETWLQVRKMLETGLTPID